MVGGSITLDGFECAIMDGTVQGNPVTLIRFSDANSGLKVQAAFTEDNWKLFKAAVNSERKIHYSDTYRIATRC